MPSGWTRLLLENFEFPFEVVYPPMLDAGNLRAKYDVLVFNDAGCSAAVAADVAAAVAAVAPAAATCRRRLAAMRGRRGGGWRGGGAGAARRRRRGAAARGGGAARAAGAAAAPAMRAADDRPAPFVDYPEEFTKRRGNVTRGDDGEDQEVRRGGRHGRRDRQRGAGGASQLFKLPLSNHLVKADGAAIAGTDYYVPGSVLRVAVDPKNPLAHGYGDEADIFFDNSPVWKIDRAAGAPGVELRTVAWFNSPEPLRSGWAWGQKFLDKGIQMVEANVGQGRVFVFGNDLLFRSQPHGSYKFFFNACICRSRRR